MRHAFEEVLKVKVLYEPWTRLFSGVNINLKKMQRSSKLACYMVIYLIKCSYCTASVGLLKDKPPFTKIS